MTITLRYACAITDGDEVIITGNGNQAVGDVVSRYNRSGWIEDLPSLLGQRFGHGCSLYFNTNGQKVFWKYKTRPKDLLDPKFVLYQKTEWITSLFEGILGCCRTRL